VAIPKGVHDLFVERGFGDEASLQWFVQAALVAEANHEALTGKKLGLVDGVVNANGMFVRDQRLYDELGWWSKFGHQVLDGISFVVSLVPVAGWAVSAAIDAGNAAWYMAADGVGSVDGWMTAAAVVIPFAPAGLGKAIRNLKVSEADLARLKKGLAVTVDGTRLRLDAVTGVLKQVEVPGRFPPSQPKIGDMDGGPGAWQAIKRSEDGAEYQAKISGAPRILGHPDPKIQDGTGFEYRVPYKSQPGNKNDYVYFDGFVWRGEPPKPVYLEAKDRYGTVFKDPDSFLATRQFKKWEKEAKGQLEAIKQSGKGGKIEWHFADKKVADIAREFFKDKGLKIDVIYTP
jgi:hypothetical protein